MMPLIAANKVAVDSISARIAAARGALDFAVAQWKLAITVQDQLGYREPPVWYPLRESLGALLLRSGRPRQAEAVFRQDLARNRSNPRSLFGLAQTLAAEHRIPEAHAAEEAFAKAWRGGSILRLGEY